MQLFFALSSPHSFEKNRNSFYLTLTPAPYYISKVVYEQDQFYKARDIQPDFEEILALLNKEDTPTITYRAALYSLVTTLTLKEKESEGFMKKIAKTFGDTS